MKNLTLLTLTTMTLLSFSSCSSTTAVNPSQNEALNAISTSNKATDKKGAMQSSLDNWLEKEWTPAVEKNEEIKAKNEDKARDFKLQEYVEKIETYKKESHPNTEESNVKKLDSMPVIGK
jgi:hypothetical protein